MKVRTLKAGTTLYGKGIAVPFTLAKDAEINFPFDSDEAFIGWLLAYKPNYDLNIGSVEGQWDQVTGRRIEPEKKLVATVALNTPKVRTVPPLVQAIRYAMANNWSDALACYEMAKLALALNDDELVAKGNSAREKTVLQNLANGVDDDGNRIFLLNAKVENLPSTLTGAH